MVLGASPVLYDVESGDGMFTDDDFEARMRSYEDWFGMPWRTAFTSWRGWTDAALPD